MAHRPNLTLYMFFNDSQTKKGFTFFDGWKKKSKEEYLFYDIKIVCISDMCR